MPKPNYSYEKRQRELAKKNKKAEKAKEKAGRKLNPQPAEGEAGLPPDGSEAVDAGAADGADAASPSDATPGAGDPAADRS